MTIKEIKQEIEKLEITLGIIHQKLNSMTDISSKENKKEFYRLQDQKDNCFDAIDDYYEDIEDIKEYGEEEQ